MLSALMAATSPSPPPPAAPAASETFLSEIIGEPALAGKMMPTGAVLDLMDIVAARAAWAHTKGGKVATVSFDRVDLLMPVCHMDLVKVTGRVVSTGSSSLVVEVKGFKEDIATRRMIRTASSFVTMVLMDNNMRPMKNAVPQLLMETDEDKNVSEMVYVRRKLFMEWDAMLKTEMQSSERLTPEQVEDAASNANKREYLTVPQTKVVVRKQSMPRNLNHHQTLFGGDIIKWMEQTATYTAQRFTANPTPMITLAMNRITFKSPITINDVIQMEAEVVYVRKYILEVQVHCFVDPPSGKLRDSHTGYFTVMNLDSLGFKRPIVTGIKLEEDDQESLKKYKLAKSRFAFDAGVSPAAGPAKELQRIRTGEDENDTETNTKFYLS